MFALNGQKAPTSWKFVAVGAAAATLTLGLTALTSASASTVERVAYSFDSSPIVDSSPHATNAGAFGDASLAPGKHGMAIAFDGQGRAQSKTNIRLSRSFTLETWVKVSEISQYATLVSVDNNHDLYLENGELRYWDGRNGYAFGRSVQLNTWTHVAVTYQSGQLTGYVNGSETGNATATLSPVSGPVELGAIVTNSSASDFLFGSLDDVRIYASAISAQQIATDMNTPVTPTTTSFPGLPWESTTSTSTSTTALPATTTSTTTKPVVTTTTAVRNTTTTTTAPRNTETSTNNVASMRFYGTQRNDLDRVKIPLPNKSVNVSGDLTIEWWMRTDTSAGNGTGNCRASGSAGDLWINGQILIDRDIDSDLNYGDYGISIYEDGRLSFGVANNSGGATLCSSATVNNGAWHNVAVTRSSGGQICLLVDGGSRTCANGPSGNVSYNANRSTSRPNSDPFLVFGAEKHDYASAGNGYHGWLDELRISNSVRYSGGYTPQRSELSADASTVAIYHFDEAAGSTLGDSAGNNNGQVMSGSAWDRNSKPF